MRIKTILLCAVLILALAVAASAQSKKGSKEDYTKHPGYVDFNTFAIFGEEEAKVEVYLKQPMLKLVSKFAKNEDPEIAELLENLALVRVHIFETDEAEAKKFVAESSKIFKTLEGKGYTFVTTDDVALVRAVERRIGKRIPRRTVEGIADVQLTDDRAGETRSTRTTNRKRFTGGSGRRSRSSRRKYCRAS